MYNIKSFGYDSLDREMIQVGKLSFTIIKKLPFKKWVENKIKDYNTFLGFKNKDKERIFLLWKHGLSDEANLAIEATDRYLISLYRGRNLNEIEDEGYRYAIQNKLSFEDRCIAIKKEIGLIEDYNMPEEIKDAFDTFGGQVKKIYGKRSGFAPATKEILGKGKVVI